MSKKYKNPPIVEALCEFQFESDAPWDLVMPGLIYDELRETFPGREPNRVLSKTLDGPGAGVQYNEAISFLRGDEKVAVLVGPNVLSVNHLAPYSSWEEFVPLIKRSFEVYRNVVDPRQLRSMQLRYINDITVSRSQPKLEDYLNLYPFVGCNLPQDFSSFITGIQIPHEDRRDSLRIEAQGSSDTESDSMRITLDLDYLLLEANKVDLNSVFNWLDKAHLRIENAFESCITNEARQIFGEVAE